ncbi:MAG: hypothetical protein Q9227_006557 [Pyrenula ochraceoflavens]
MTKESYLIIGAGAFGASTALHLSRCMPSGTPITLVDRAPFPSPHGASWDINKVVRADYASMFYTKLGLQTLKAWRTNPLFKPFYHQSGMITIFPSKSNIAEDMLRNFKESGEHYEAELISVERCKEMFNGFYKDANYDDVENILWNPLCGWAEASRALETTISEAIRNGVQYEVGSVARAVVDDQGVCTGALMDDGREFSASHVILSTGANTAKVLADSFPKKQELWAAKRTIAAGVVVGAVDLTSEQIDKYKDVPVFVLDANETQGQTMPPTPDGKLKFNRDIPFTNTVTHSPSGHEISVPLIRPSSHQYLSPSELSSTYPSLFSEVNTVISGIYGPDSLEQLKPTTYRLCWDASTRDENFYISPHHRVQNLYIATAGTWHGWKFLPIIGEYVVKMLQGELGEEERKKWDWDRDLSGVPDWHMTAGRELKDLERKE